MSRPDAHAVERWRRTVRAGDGATSVLQIHVPVAPRALLFWMPALGVGLKPNEAFADAMAAAGIAIAIHEWRGLGASDRRAARYCDWGYRDLLETDLPAGLDAARAEFPRMPLWLGGHSFGGQLALIEAARARRDVAGVAMVATSQPDWRRFPGWRKYGVAAFAGTVRLVTAMAGHFPGRRLGFAGREARTVMNEWAATCLRGDYAIPALADIPTAMGAYRGRVVSICMTRDHFAPRRGSERLQELAPNADWRFAHLDASAFARQSADHFGWLREPRAVVDALLAGMDSAHVIPRMADRAADPCRTDA